MDTKFRIVWKNTVTGRTGHGTKEFTAEEADALVAELNAEYPLIDHWKEEVK